MRRLVFKKGIGNGVRPADLQGSDETDHSDAGSRASNQELPPFLRRHAETEFGLWKVTGFVLFSSVPAPEGPGYTVELRREFPAQ